MTRGVLIGVGRGAIGDVGRSGGRITVGSRPPGGTSSPLVWCGSFTVRPTPTSGGSGPRVWLTGSTIAGVCGGTTGSSRGTGVPMGCLLYTSDAADERSSVDLGGRRI